MKTNMHYSDEFDAASKDASLLGALPNMSSSAAPADTWMSADLMPAILMSEMAATLVHELNTPIGTITNLLQGMQLRIGKPETTPEQIDVALVRAIQQAQFTKNVINRIKDISIAKKPDFQVIDVYEQLCEALSLTDWLLTKNNCAVEFESPQEPAFVLGDATMLQQVFVNLIKNAIDAMQAPTGRACVLTLSISRSAISNATNQNKECVLISIADNGPGLVGSADKVFDAFVSGKTDGMGIGLNICKSFIDWHKGNLWLSNNAVYGCSANVELDLKA